MTKTEEDITEMRATTSEMQNSIRGIRDGEAIITSNIQVSISNDTYAQSGLVL